MVNTFVTHGNLIDIARSLDYRRLGKQRLEAKEIIKILEQLDQNIQSNIGWQNHPATKMWYGYTNALKVYFNHMVREWISRGYQNTMILYQIDESRYYINPYMINDKGEGYFQYPFTEYSFPPWFGFPPLILSHRASLYRKDPNYYASFYDSTLQPYINLGYLWPCFWDNSIYSYWDMKYLEPIGSGAPAQYRLSRDECIVWLQNPYVNPKTGRSISQSGSIYKDYLSASKFYGFIS